MGILAPTPEWPVASCWTYFTTIKFGIFRSKGMGIIMLCYRVLTTVCDIWTHTLSGRFLLHDWNMVLLYRMGHEKVARLPFCTCPCDILSGVSMYILSRCFWTVSQQSCCHHSPPPLVVLDRMLLVLTHQSSLRKRATFSWPTLYISICTIKKSKVDEFK